MSFAVTAAVVGAGISLYSIHEQSKTASEGLDAQKSEADRQYNLQLAREKDLKDKQANADALESSKIIRARRQAVLFGGATKNNTIKTGPKGAATMLGESGDVGGGAGPVGGGGFSGGGAKTLLGS